MAAYPLYYRGRTTWRGVEFAKAKERLSALNAMVRGFITKASQPRKNAATVAAPESCIVNLVPVLAGNDIVSVFTAGDVFVQGICDG
jgi:hypothetical protein